MGEGAEMSKVLQWNAELIIEMSTQIDPSHLKSLPQRSWQPGVLPLAGCERSVGMLVVCQMPAVTTKAAQMPPIGWAVVLTRRLLENYFVL